MVVADATFQEPELVDEPLDLSLLRELGKNALINSLNTVNGVKTLVLDPALAGQLNLLTEVSTLKHHGVDKMFWLESGPLSASTVNVVYLTRPRIKWIKIIADQIKGHLRDGQKHTYTLLLVPRVSTLVNRILEEEGVLGEVNVSAFNLQFIPIAEDVVSLENENAFKEIYLDGDETVVYDSAQALLTLQKLFGDIPRVVGKGDCAGRLTGLLSRQMESDKKTSGERAPAGESKFDSLIVLDRRVDMITPMLTQLTYEGLVDEMIGIKNSHVELPASLVSPPNPQPSANAPNTSVPSASTLAKESKKKYHLNSSDSIFNELRDLNFSVVGKTLNKHARRLDEDYKRQKDAKTVAQLRDFVGKLGGLQSEHQSLRIHTGVSEMLVPMTRTEQFNQALEIQQNLLSSYEVSNQITAIEDLIAQGAGLPMVVRLLCLATIVNGGIKTKTLEGIKREILQTYGYENLPLLLSLSSDSLGLVLPSPLPPKPSTGAGASLAAFKVPYSALRKSLRLVTEEEPEQAQGESEAPADVSYVFSGYAPLSVRLVQCVVQKGGVVGKVGAGTGAGANDRGKGKGAAVARSAGAGGSKVRAHPILGWKGFEDVLENLPGETIDVSLPLPLGTERSKPAPAPVIPGITPEKSTVSIVFFLGGCTYAEVSALRLINKTNHGRRILIATTGMISGNSLINSLVVGGGGRGGRGGSGSGGSGGSTSGQQAL